MLRLSTEGPDSCAIPTDLAVIIAINIHRTEAERRTKMNIL
jgi:hypothetical protein